MHFNILCGIRNYLLALLKNMSCCAWSAQQLRCCQVVGDSLLLRCACFADALHSNCRFCRSQRGRHTLLWNTMSTLQR